VTKPIPKRDRSGDIPPLYRQWLRTGSPGYLIYLETEHVKALWAEHGQSIIAEHIERWPGTRPPNFWRYDAPSPRDPSQETQREYLARHGLLEPEERG